MDEAEQKGVLLLFRQIFQYRSCKERLLKNIGKSTWTEVIFDFLSFAASVERILWPLTGTAGTWQQADI